MPTPGSSSGTYTFAPDNASIVTEAFDRINLPPQALERHHLISARSSLNYSMQTFSNKGVNLWKVVNGTINLVAGQAPYTMRTDLVDITEVYYTTVNGNGSGYNSDRFMTPLTRTEYAMLPNKLQPGTPTSYWFQRLQTPILTIWQPAAAGAPNYVINWFGLQRLQDAGIGGGETPDMVYRGLDALVGDLAWRLAVKFAPDLQQARKADAQEAWDMFVANDQEAGPVLMQPAIGIYGRM